VSALNDLEDVPGHLAYLEEVGSKAIPHACTSQKADNGDVCMSNSSPLCAKVSTQVLAPSPLRANLYTEIDDVGLHSN